MSAKAQKEIVLGVTGSIAAYRACDIICRLKEEDFNITAVMTDEARHFITPLSLQHLTGNKVITEMFSLPDNYDPLHTSLADRAALILVAPATANIIGKVANGICDDALTCTILAAKSPVLFAPAMNDRMYAHKSVQENISRLKRMGYKFIGPKKGRLACGDYGIGHIEDTDRIVSAVKRALER